MKAIKTIVAIVLLIVAIPLVILALPALGIIAIITKLLDIQKSSEPTEIIPPDKAEPEPKT